MINQYSINGNAWTQITTAGKSAVIWINSMSSQYVKVWHGSVTPDSSVIERAYPLSSGQFANLIPDDSNDVYWVICDDSGDTANVSVDVEL